jgi:hypothetical protein
MANLTRGANKLCEFTLYASDGTTPAPASGFVSIVAKVMQFGRTKASYTLGTDTEITSASNVVTVEIDTDLSESFSEGNVSVKLILDETDADFTEDGFKRCIPEEDVFTVIP